MADKELQNATDFPTLSGSFAYRAALVVAGATQGTATIKAAPIHNEEERTIYNLPSGNTVLTLAIARYDLIVADNPVMSTLEIPQNATLGYTYAAGKEIRFYVQNRGLGGLTINFSGTATLDVDNDIDPATLGQRHTPVCVTSSVVDVWNYE